MPRLVQNPHTSLKFFSVNVKGASYDDPITFHIPDGLLKSGENILAVRGHDRGTADFLDVNVTVIQSANIYGNNGI